MDDKTAEKKPIIEKKLDDKQVALLEEATGVRRLLLESRSNNDQEVEQKLQIHINTIISQLKMDNNDKVKQTIKNDTTKLQLLLDTSNSNSSSITSTEEKPLLVTYQNESPLVKNSPDMNKFTEIEHTYSPEREEEIVGKDYLIKNLLELEENRQNLEEAFKKIIKLMGENEQLILNFREKLSNYLKKPTNTN